MRREKSIVNLMLIYFVFTFFYGIIIKFTRDNTLLFTVKTYIPEILLVIIAALCLLDSHKRLSKFNFIGVAYLFCVILVSAVFCGMTDGGVYTVRDMFLPIFVSMILTGKLISEDSLERFYTIFEKICFVYLIAGAILGVVEFINGWEWTAKFYAGYSFYNVDSYTKVAITESAGQLRAPGLTGNHVSFSYYGLVALIALLASKRLKLFWKIFFGACEVVILMTTLNKTAIVCLALVIYFYLFRRMSRSGKFVSLGLFGICAVAYIYINSSNLVFSSTLQRLNFWGTITDYTSVLELIFPYRCFEYNPNASGILSFWDNTYLYLLFSTGVIGLVWIYSYCYKLYKRNTICHESLRFMFELLFIFLLLSSLFNNITNGRAYFTVYLMINSLYYRKDALYFEYEEGRASVRYADQTS